MPLGLLLSWSRYWAGLHLTGDENTEAILAAYYPGSQGGKAIAEVLFGDYNPHGKLPVQMPRSMSQVLSQRSDLPFDIENPLYDFGFGLSY